MKFSLGKPHVEDGQYESEFVGGRMKATHFGESYIFDFKLDSGIVVGRISNPGSRSPKSALVETLAGLAGIAPDAAGDIDDAKYIGCRYLIDVVTAENGWPRVTRIVCRLNGSEPAPF